MENNSEAWVLRILIGSTDQINQTPLYEYIVIQAKKKGIAGATVVKGIMGFGASSVIHSYKFWEVSDKVPLVVELVDEEDKIRSFYEILHPQLEAMKYGCLVTMEKISVLLYKSGQKKMFDI
jgi:PII-like signaling protein